MSFDPFGSGTAVEDAPEAGFDPFAAGTAKADDDGVPTPRTPGAAGAGPQKLDPSSLFGGVENFEKVLPADTMTALNNSLVGSVDPVADKKRAANIAFLSDRFGKDPSELAPVYDQYKQVFAKQVLGESQPLDDSAFYGKVGGYLKQQTDQSAMLHGLLGPLFTGIREGQDFGSVYEQAMSGAKTGPGFDPKNQDFYRQFAYQQWSALRDDQSRLADPIEAVSQYMKVAKARFTPGTEGQIMIERQKALAALSGLAPDQAELVMDFAAGNVTSTAQDEQPGLLSRVGTAMKRSVADVTEGAIGAAQEFARNFLPPDDAAAGRRQSQLSRQLDQRVNGEVDPLKGQGWIANQVLTVAESAPKIAATMTPAGIVALMMESKERLRGDFEDKGMSVNQADALSSVAAIPDVAMQFLSSKMILGRVPGVSALLRANLATRVAATVGMEAVGLTGISEAQQASVPAIVSIAHQLDSTVPLPSINGKEQSFLDQLSAIGKATPETMASLLPFILIGTASASFRDRTYGQEFLKIRDRLTAAGLKPDAIDHIVDAPTPEEASSVLQAHWGDREMGPTQQAAVADLNAQSLQIRQDMGENYSPTSLGLFAKYPTELNSIDPGHIPVEIQGKDGKVFVAEMNGYQESYGKLHSRPEEDIITVPHIGYSTERGWSHTALRDGEAILTKIPTPEQWQAGIRDPDAFVNGAGVRDAARSDGSGTPTPFEQDLISKWKASITADQSGNLNVADQHGPLGQANTPEGAAEIILDRTGRDLEAQVAGPTETTPRPASVSPVAQPSDALFRADVETPGSGKHWTTEMEAASLYRYNPGFGGPHLFGAEMPEGKLLEIKSPADWRKLAENAGVEVPNTRVYDLAYDPQVQEFLKKEGYSGIKHPDDFPEGAPTVFLMGEPKTRRIEDNVVSRWAHLADAIEKYPKQGREPAIEILEKEISFREKADAAGERENLKILRNDFEQQELVAMLRAGPDGAWGIWRRDVLDEPLTENKETSSPSPEPAPAATPETPGGDEAPTAPAPPEVKPEPPSSLLEFEKRVDARLAKIRAEGRSFSLGLDPEQGVLLAVKGAVKIARGFQDFASWSHEMLREFGETIQPHLEELYNSSKAMLAQHMAQAEVSTAIDRVRDPNADTEEHMITARASAGEGIAEKWSDAARDAMQGQNYDVRHMADVRAQADRQMLDVPAAVSRFLDPRSDLPADVRTALGLKLATHFDTAGDFQAWHQTMMRLAEYGTSAGQGINMFKDWGGQYEKPEQAQMLEIQEVQGKKRKLRKQTRSDEVADIVADETKKNQAEKDIVQKLKDRMEKLTGLLNEGDLLKIAGEVGPKFKPEVSEEIKNLQIMIAGATKNLKGELKNQLDMHETKLRDLAFKIEENTRLLNEGTPEEIKKHLGENPKVHVNEQVAQMRKLLRDSRKALEAWIADPTDFDARVKARFKEKNIQTPKDIKGTYGRALELFNEGKLSGKALEELILSKQFHLPDMTPERMQELAEHARMIASTPRGSNARREAITALLDDVHNHLAPVSRIDTGFALLYAHILAGYGTHVRKVLSEASAVAEFGMEGMLSHPARWADKWAGIVEGGRTGLSEGFQEAKQLVATGKRSTLDREDKFGQSGILERTQFTGIARAYNMSKYVGRLLRAETVFFATTAYEVKSRQIAMEMAKNELGRGADPAKLSERVDQMLNRTPQQISDFHVQAEQEYALLHPNLQKGGQEAWVANRERELTMTNRSHDLVERASTFQARMTYNYKPEGLIGYFANLMLNGFAGLRKAGEESESPFLRVLSLAPRLEVPFIQIPANLFARAWDYGSGISIVKALAGKELIYKGGFVAHYEEMSEDARSMMLKRGIAGLGTLATLAVMGYPTTGKEERDRLWRIHGRGTGEIDKDKALWGPKWKPFSIQFNVGKSTYFVPYQWLPIGPALAMVGAYHDGVRYKQFDAKDGSYRLASSFLAMPQAMFSQSFFKQLSDTADAIMGTGHKSEQGTRLAIARATAGTVTSAIIPLANLVNSVDREFDPNVRDISSVKAALLSQVVGLRHLNGVKLDILGEPIENRPFDWFYTQAARDTPEAKIYATFARLGLDPGDGSGERLKLGDKFADFYKARQSFIRDRLLRDGASLLDNIAHSNDVRARELLHPVTEAATARALKDVGYKAPAPPKALRTTGED